MFKELTGLGFITTRNGKGNINNEIYFSFPVPNQSKILISTGIYDIEHNRYHYEFICYGASKNANEDNSQLYKIKTYEFYENWCTDFYLHINKNIGKKSLWMNDMIAQHRGETGLKDFVASVFDKYYIVSENGKFIIFNKINFNLLVEFPFVNSFHIYKNILIIVTDTKIIFVNENEISVENNFTICEKYSKIAPEDCIQIKNKNTEEFGFFNLKSKKIISMFREVVAIFKLSDNKFITRKINDNRYSIYELKI